MKKHLLKLVALFSLFALVACATSARGKAIQSGTIAKEVVDGAALVTATLIDDRAEKCEPKIVEGEAALRECLGFAADVDKVEAAFEAARAAQLTLYLALARNASAEELQAAVVDLMGSVSVISSIVSSLKGEE